jgi:hypothetical protein
VLFLCVCVVVERVSVGVWRPFLVVRRPPRLPTQNKTQRSMALFQNRGVSSAASGVRKKS